MRKLLVSLLLAAGLLAAVPAQAEVHQLRYGVAETVNFKLYNADGTLDVDEADGGTEVSLSCDEGAETTATNDFADEGNFYSIALTAAELKCERVTVVVAATTTEVFFIETSALNPGVSAFGTAQSGTGTTIVLAAATSYADDFLNCHTVVLTGGTGAGQTRSITDWVNATDTATVATWVTNPDNTTVYEVYATACATGSVSIATGGIVAGSFAAGAIDAAAIATVAIDADAIAADSIGASEVATDAIGSAEIAADAIGASEVATDAVGAAEVAADAIGASEIAANALTTAEIATGAISSDEVADNAIDAGALATDGVTEITAAMLAAQGSLTGTCDSGSTTTCVDNALTQADATQLEDRLMCYDDGWCALITTFTPGSDQATHTKVAPSTRASKVYTIFPSTLE
jgi:hypothetical protein